MKITAGTNVLVRAAVQDDKVQAAQAAQAPREAALVAVPLPVLCEFVWVLGRGYKKSSANISEAIRRLMGADNVVINRPAVEAGLLNLERFRVQNHEDIVACAVLTVMLSTMVHGVSANPMATCLTA